MTDSDFWIRREGCANSPESQANRIFLGGRFTFRAIDQFRDLLDAVEQSGAPTYVIDLGGVSFMDTAALWMLRVALSEAKERGRALTIEGATGEVKNLVRLSGFDPQAGLDSIFGNGHMQWRSVVVQEGASWPQDHRPILTAEPTPSNIAAGLSTPYFGFIEAGEDPHPRCLMAVAQGGLAMSVSTGVSCSVEVVQPFAAAVATAMGGADQAMIELCLAEAVGNAAIHGNLGIDGALRSTREGFEIFSRLMGERLADPRTANKRIDVIMLPLENNCYRLSVTDRGDGFDFEKAQQIVAGPNAKHGRGIALIRRIARQVFTEHGGRTLVMDFSV